MIDKMFVSVHVVVYTNFRGPTCILRTDDKKTPIVRAEPAAKYSQYTNPHGQ